MTRLRILMGLLFSAAVIASSACGGGDDTPTGTPLPSGRTPAPTPANAESSLSELASGFLAGIDGKYEYHYTGPIGTATEGTLTIYRLGLNDRQDLKTNAFNIEATTATILRADGKNYTCTIAPNYNYCQESTVPEIESLRVFSSPVYDALAALVVNPDQFEFEDLPEETIADLASTCYGAFSDARIGEGPPLSEDITACFTEDGVLSYFERTMTPESAAIEPSTFTLELQTVGEAVAADFEPTGQLP